MVLHSTLLRLLAFRRRLTASLLFAVVWSCFTLLGSGQSGISAVQAATPDLFQTEYNSATLLPPQRGTALLITQGSLTVAKVGNGAGRIASAPIGIDCGADCTEFYDQGALVTLTAGADPGSTFTGWQGACTGVGAVCSTTVSTVTNVTAVFTLNQYQLTTAKAGNGLGKLTSFPAGIDCGNDCTEFYGHGASVTITANADSSSTFAGWIGACTGNTPTCTLSMEAAKSVTAIFILNQYAFTLTKSGTGEGKVVSVPSGLDCGNACSASYPHGTTLNLTATAAAGSTFTGWQGACTGTAPTCSITMDAAKAVTALFSLNQYTLTTKKSGNGSGVIGSTPSGIDCGSTCTAVYGYGANVSLTASAAANTLFTGWSGACTGNTPACTVAMDASKSVTATFVLKQYPVVVQKIGNGLGKVVSQPGAIDCGNTCSDLYNHGTVTTLTATAEATSRFIGWQGACTGSTPTCTVTVDAAKAVTATFALKQYSLTIQQKGAGTVTVQPGGSTCSITCTRQLDQGTIVTLTATAAVSSTFTGWQGACTGSNARCTVIMDTAKTVTATFALKQYALSVVKRGAGTGSITSIPPGINCGITCTQNLQHGTPITLTATAAANSLFAGWQGACTGTTLTCTITINAAQQVTATFTLKQYALTVTRHGNGQGIVTSSPPGLTCGITCTVNLTHGTQITLTATVITGTRFMGWQGACTGENPRCMITADSSKAVTATFTLTQYTVGIVRDGTGSGAVTSLPPGIACGITCTMQVNHGTRITVTATAAISSTFTSWRGACTGQTPSCTLTIDRDQQITATFALNTYELTVSRTGKGGGVVTSMPAGIDCGVACTLRAPYGTVITVTAAPDPISTFTGWQGACRGTAPQCTVTLAAAQAVTATFSHQQYPLTVTKTGSGAGIVTSLPPAIDCGITCTALLDHGAVITLTTSAGARSSFTGWTGACTGLNACVVTMNAAQAITATFTGDPVLSLSAAIMTTPTLATAGQGITYTYQITNTGDLSVTVAAMSAHYGSLGFIRLSEQQLLAPESYLPPGATVLAVRQIVAPRCDTTTPWGDTLVVTGTTSSGVVTTTQATIMVPITNSVLPPQAATANTIYIGCTIQMAMGRSGAVQQPAYDMVVISGAAPNGLLFAGVQSIQPYRDAFTLQEQTNALLREGCPTNAGCRTVRRLRIEQGKAIGVETITEVTLVRRVFMPLVRK